MDANLGQAKDRSLLLKIDIDSGMEWNIFAEEPVSFLQKFRQIVVVYHQTNLIQNHQLYLEAGKNLEAAGFAVAHLHGNNRKSGMHKFESYQLPTDIEVTYVQKTAQGCSSGLPYNVPEDMPSDLAKTELEAAILPRNLHGAPASKVVRKHATTMPPD